jgi:Zn-dependent protease
MLSDVTPLNLVLILVSIVIALSIHEAMHGYVAHWLGDSTAHDAGRLTLNPLKHIDLFTTVLLPMVLILAHVPPIFAAKPVPFNPERLKYDEFGAALVGVAGPLTNLTLAAAAAIIFRTTGVIPGSFFYNALLVFTEVNIGFFIFNMIPFPPLDGSRLLYAVAPEPLQEVMQQIEAAGFLPTLVFIFFIFQFVSGPIVNIENSLLTFLLG